MMPNNQHFLDENVNLKIKVKNLELELQHYKDFICKLSSEKQDNSVLETQLQNQQAFLEALKREHQMNQSQLEQQNIEIRTLRHQLEQSKQKSVDLEKSSRENISANEKLGTDLRKAYDNLNKKNFRIEELERRLREPSHNPESFNEEIQSLKEAIKTQKKDNDNLWDSMMFYKNKVDFPSSGENSDFQERIQKLETELNAERKIKNELILENSHLKGPNDPDGCDICYGPLPLSRCLTPNCRGIYHNKCITRWFTQKKNNQCLMCTNTTVKIGDDYLGREELSVS